MSVDPVSIGVSLALTATSMAITASQHFEGPRVQDLKATSADYGTALTNFYGRRVFNCPVFWAEDLKDNKRRRKTKGGKMTTHYATGTCAVHVADHEISSVVKIWADEHLIWDRDGENQTFKFGDDYDLASHMRFYLGTADQQPDPRMLATIEAQHGAGTCPAYRHQAYFIIEDVPLDLIGNRYPQWRVEAETSSYTADVIDGLMGGYNEDGGGYAYIMNSPDKSRSVLSHGLLSSGRFVSIENARGGYNPIEREPADPFGSAAFIDNDGYVYGSSVNGVRTWKFAPDGTRTQVGSDNDLPLNSTGTPIFHLAGLYEVGGVDTLFYACASSGAMGVIYSRPTSGGPVIEHDSEDDTGTALPRARFMTQDGAGNVWAVSLDPGGDPITSVWFWCVGGPAVGNYHIVTGFPSLTLGQTGSYVWPVWHDGYFYVLWGTSNSTRYVVKVDGATFTVAGSVNIITAVGVTPGDAGHNVYLGSGGPTIDTQRNHLIVIEYTTAQDDQVHRIDLDTLTAVTETVDGWPARVGLTAWPPIDSASDPDVVYPRYTMWHDPIGGLLALPESGDFLSDPFRIAYPPDFAFLFLGSGVTLGTIFNDLSLRSGLAADEFDFTAFNQPVFGFSWTQGTPKQIAGWLLDTYDCDIVPHDFRIVGKKRGSEPVGTIPSSEFVKSDDRYTLPYISDRDLPRLIHFTFADANAEQNPNTATAQRLSSAVISEKALSIDAQALAMTPDEAKQCVDRYHRRQWFARTPADFSVTRGRLGIEPGDVWTGSLDGTEVILRATKVKVGANGVLAMEWDRDDPALYILSGAAGASADGHVPSEVFWPSDTLGDVLDIPLLVDAHDQPTPFAYLVATPIEDGAWTGASFSHSDTGEEGTFDPAWDGIGSNEAAIMGEATDALDEAEPWVMDNASSVTVEIESGELTSTTEDAMLANGAVNLAALESADGYELFQFRDAELVGENTYVLTGLLRGVRGTEQHIAGHSAGDRFVAPVNYKIHVMGASEIGDTDSYVVSTYGVAPDEDDAFALLFNANAHRPYAPVDGSLTEDGGDILIDAVRRTRVGGSAVSGQDVPLGEVSEAWEADIFDGATFKRTISGTSLPLVYSAADIATDAVSDLVVKLYQMSPALNLRGFPLTIT